MARPYFDGEIHRFRVTLCLRDAGHILGSANVTLEIQENGRTIRLGFTGDIGRPLSRPGQGARQALS